MIFNTDDRYNNSDDGDITTLNSTHVFLWNNYVYLLMGFIICLSWLSYPMLFGNYKPLLFKGVSLFLLFVTATTMILSDTPGMQINYLQTPEYVIPILFYLGYLFFITIASFTHLESLTNIVMLFTKIFFAWLLLMFLPWRYNFRLFDIYSKFIIILALLAIIQLILIAKGIIHPLAIISTQAGGGKERLYEFYGLGVTNAGYVMNIAGVTVTRLQSFADEPGTFAVALMPALIWAFYKRWKIATLICITALLLTLSIGAWLAMVFAGFLMLYKRSKKTVLLTGLSIIILLPLFYMGIPNKYREAFQMYSEKKISFDEEGQTNTSFSIRLTSLLASFQVLWDQPWGYGINEANTVTTKITGYNTGNSYVSALIDSGIIGGLMYFMTFFWLFILSIKSLLKERNAFNCFIFATFIALYIMSWQRTGFDSSFWGFWILITLLKIRLSPEVLK